MPAALRKTRTKVARETCDSAASSSRVQSSAGALSMAVTARAEDGEARSFIRPLDDADCSRCTAEHHDKERGGEIGGDSGSTRASGREFLIDRLHQHPHAVE